MDIFEASNAVLASAPGFGNMISWGKIVRVLLELALDSKVSSFISNLSNNSGSSIKSLV